MVKYTEDYDTIKNVLGHIKNVVYKNNIRWSDNNTLIVIGKSGKEDGSIKFNDKELDIVGEKINSLYKKLKKKYDDIIKHEVKETDLVNTPLRDMLNRRESINGFQKNNIVVNLLNKKLSDMGFEKVNIEKPLSRSETIKDKLFLAISSSASDNGKQPELGWSDRMKTFLFDEFNTDKNNKNDIPIIDVVYHKNLEDEEVISLEYKHTIIGYYYPERNFVNILFNPFGLKTQSVLEDKLPEVWNILFKVMKDNNVKTKDISKTQEKMFVSEFMKNIRDKADNMDATIEDIRQRIQQYERTMRDTIAEHNDKLIEKEFLNNLVKSGGKGLYAEVKKVEKLPFIEELKIEGGTIDMKFRPSFLPIPDMKRFDGGKSYGKRYVWIGSIGFKISSSDFSVYGDVNLGGHCHPHASGYPSGSPCFGSGDGRNKIYELLSNNKFEELAKMLWFWIKTYKNSGAYIKMWDVYDSALSNGYPVLDAKGKRIEINDPERIKTEEQIKLTKSDNYEHNKKIFSKTKLEA